MGGDQHEHSCFAWSANGNAGSTKSVKRMGAHTPALVFERIVKTKLAVKMRLFKDALKATGRG